MKRATNLGMALLVACLVSACGESPLMSAPSNTAASPMTRTRALSLARPSTPQKTLLDQFSHDESRPIALKKDPFGHGVLTPSMSTAETKLLKTLDADRRSIEENTSRSLPGGLRQRSATHFHFFFPQQQTVPRLVPLFQPTSKELLGFRAEVELSGNNPEEGHDLYFAYYDRNGKLLAANG
jgi:hypothetical protein